VALVVAAFGLVGCVLGAWLGDPARALGSYLLAFVYWLSLSLGALGALIIFHISGARWVLPLRRLLEVLALGVVLAPPLLIPILLGQAWLYPWARPGFGPHRPDMVLTLREPYLTSPFFVARSLFYVACWAAAAVILHRWSLRQDQHPTERQEHLQRRLASATAPMLLFTVTWAAYDWLMSLTPDWASELYGAYFLVGALVAGLAWAIAFAAFGAREERILELARDGHFHNLGKLLFASVCVWAYLAFDQYMLIWIANKPEEILFYIERTENSWRPVFIALVLAHFVVPFGLLLGRRPKQNPNFLSAVCGLLLVAHALDLFWLVVPSLGDRRPRWTDLAAFLGVGGLQLAFLLWRLGRTQLNAVEAVRETKWAGEGAST
jgi:hypothetical protein